MEYIELEDTKVLKTIDSDSFHDGLASAVSDFRRRAAFLPFLKAYSDTGNGLAVVLVPPAGGAMEGKGRALMLDAVAERIEELVRSGGVVSINYDANQKRISLSLCVE